MQCALGETASPRTPVADESGGRTIEAAASAWTLTSSGLIFKPSVRFPWEGSLRVARSRQAYVNPSIMQSDAV
jgi:hypothetical protein